MASRDLGKALSLAQTKQELENVLATIVEREDEIDSKLDALVINGKSRQEENAESIKNLSQKLRGALVLSNEMTAKLSSTSDEALKISSKVRSIDIERTRAKEALTYVSDVIDLKKSIVSLHDAMDAREWDRAARFIHQANALPKDLRESKFAKAMVPTSEIPDYPEETLQDAASSLCVLFTREFNSSVAAKDMERATKYFKLFPLIGREREGIDLYAKFIRSIITSYSRTLIQRHHSDETTQGSPMFYGIAMTSLFENIALIISQHSHIVERYYQKIQMLKVISSIQDETDSQAGLILDTFWDERRIERYISDINNYPYQFLVDSFTGSSRPFFSRATSPNGRGSGEYRRSAEQSSNTDMKEVTALVAEASVILNRWTLYQKFLAVKFRELQPQGDYEKLHLPEIIKTSMFKRKVSNKLLPSLETMTTYAFRRAIERAFQLEELPDLTSKFTEETPVVTSVVDDIMYMFKTLVQQVLSTGEVSLLRILVANFKRILESDYVGMIQRRLKEVAPRQQSAPPRLSTPQPGGRTVSGSGKSVGSRELAGLTGNDENRLRTFLVYLNNLSVSAKYVDRILKGINYESFLPFDDDAMEIAESFSALGTSFISKCNELSTDGVQVLYATVVNMRLRMICTAMVKGVDFMKAPSLNEDDADDDNSMSATFGYYWNGLMKEFAWTLSPDLYNKFISHVASSLSRLLEKWIWTLGGRINELGAISLDREVSRIIGIVSEGNYALREKFVRVAQIIMIIGMDEGDEEEGVIWALTDTEQNDARKIRI